MPAELFQCLFHGGRIRNNTREQQSAKEVRWRDDCVSATPGLNHSESHYRTRSLARNANRSDAAVDRML